MNPEKSRNHLPEKKKDAILSQRLLFLIEQDTSLEILDEIGYGETSTVFDCTKNKDGVLNALKVSRRSEGIDESEISVLKRLSDVDGIPKLLQTYKDKEIVIALLMEKIKGEKFRSYFSLDKKGVSEVFLKIRKLVKEFHSRGLLMPRDWLKEDNWLIAKNDQPYLLDLGESEHINKDYEEARAQIEGDIRSFHNLIFMYVDKINKKDKKKLDSIIIEDFFTYFKS